MTGIDHAPFTTGCRVSHILGIAHAISRWQHSAFKREQETRMKYCSLPAHRIARAFGMQYLKAPLASAALGMTLLAGCGGGSPSAPNAAPAPEGGFTVGGSISGLTTEGLVLSNNGADTLAVAGSATAFTFPARQPAGASYNVGIAILPPRYKQVCAVSNAAGTVANANISTVVVSCRNVSAVVTTLAGDVWRGYADGTGSMARFYFPQGVTVDSIGNVYVADSVNNRIRKITAAGLVTTFAGGANAESGSGVDGTGAAARFSRPAGVAMDNYGNVLVADGGHNLIRRITPDGVVTTIAGTGERGWMDGSAAAASFNSPQAVAVDSEGSIYVADAGNVRIRKVSRSGIVTTLAGNNVLGCNDGVGAEARFGNPFGVTVDTSNNVYVADYGCNAIRKITPAGVVTTLAGITNLSGGADGHVSSASFCQPQGVAADRTGNLYVTDRCNNAIRMITSAGVVTTVAGTAVPGYADGIGNAARFSAPYGIAVDSAGNLYVGDTDNNMVRKVTASE